MSLYLQFAHSTVRRLSMRFSRCIALSGALCLLGAGTAWGQLSLTDANADGVPDLTPAPAFSEAPSAGNITATFSAAVSSAPAGSFVAHSDRAGERMRGRCANRHGHVDADVKSCEQPLSRGKLSLPR